MKYRDILGYDKEKTPTKKQSKPKKNQILEGIKKDLNEWNDTAFRDAPKRWSGAMDKGLTEHEKQLQEGPSYEYKKDIKNIDKSYKLYGKSILNFYEKLRKKGLDDEASDLIDSYKKNIVSFKKNYDKIVDKLM